jgi:ankyrin repeat protein/L-ascorbate metabolism protein UlaG (beta-lactamase superfamily)
MQKLLELWRNLFCPINEKRKTEDHMKKACFIIPALMLFLAAASFLGANQVLLRAFASGDTIEILKIFEADAQKLEVDMGEGMTPLHYAAYYGNVPVFDYGIQHGLDLNAKDRRGLSAVWFTVSGQRPEMLRKLIALGADLSVKNSQGDNLLFRALLTGNPELVGILLENGFEPVQKNAYEMTTIDFAARSGSTEIMDLLVSYGADLKTSSGSNFPLLHHAVLSGKADTVHYLLDGGFGVDQKDEAGRTPLLLAVDFGNKAAARALIMRGADTDAADPDGIVPLQFAVKKGDTELVDLLIKHKASLDAVDARTGKTMLHEAALRGYSTTVEKLITGGADKQAKDKNGYTALSYALKYGNKTVAVLLRKAGVEEVPWEMNLDDSAYLKRELRNGEAYIWYLKHSGWALKTKSALLVFDYWDNDAPPDEKLLANGHVRPEALKDLPVYVFVSHEHGDHFDRQILDWKNQIPGITYLFGFEHEPAEGIVSLAPRSQRKIGPLEVTTIRANDAGVGFAVQVDGLTIFHAGDHSNNTLEMEGNDFFPEIDFLAEKGIRPDISFFLNMYGCGSTNPEAFQKGIFYAVDKLKIKSVLPMHGAYKEWVYENLAEGVAQNKIKVQVGAATNQGDRFFYSQDSLKKP